METATQPPLLRAQRTLSKQEEVDEEDEMESVGVGGRTSPQGSSSPPPPSSTAPQPPPTSATSIHKSRSQTKVKLLVRSHAMREETSPPPEADGSDCEAIVVGAEQSAAVRHRHKLRREGSSSEQTWSEHTPSLSRGNSREQYDGTNNPVDLHQFIVDTLNRNYKDRMLLFKIENELINLSKDSKRNTHKFGQMSSYQRMLVHRVAAYFGMEHNVDPTGTSVIVNTTVNTRLPDTRFRDFVREDLLEEPRKSILKRDSSSFDETGSLKNGERMFNGESRRSKSFEEREEEYEKVRRRIFNHQNLTDAEIDCMEEYHWEGDTGCPRCSHSHQPERGVRLLKVESYESGDTLKANSLRLQVAKSHSFNGYDHGAANNHHNQRVLTKQDSGSSMSSRISPSSSGYKSQRSDATLSATPSPSATPSLHTQTGQPYTNADGSIYHYDPGNPPQCVGGGGGAGGRESATGGTQVVSATAPPPGVVVPLTASAPKQDCVDNGVNSSPMDKIDRGVIMNNYDNGGGQVSYSPVAQAQYQRYSQPPPQHHLPLVIPPHPPDQAYHAQPQVYPQPPPPGPPHHCPAAPDPRISLQDTVNGELSSCMMGMSMDNRMEKHQQVMYWQPHYVQGGVYYSSSNGLQPIGASTPSSRYHQQVTAAPQPFSQIVPHPAPPPPPQIEHPGCYAGGGYTPTPAPTECIPPYPPTLHMYYPTCTSGNQGIAMTGGGGNNGGQPSVNGYYTGGGSCGVPGVVPAPPPQLQPPPYQTQQCNHPTPPHTPQGTCSQLTVYNGCYPGGGHYAANTGVMPQLFRKPSLQVGVRCSSPLRGYAAVSSPSLKDRMQSEEPKPPPPSLQPATVYGIRVLPRHPYNNLSGDVRLFGNAGRLPFALPSTAAAPAHNKPINNRKHKTFY